MLPWIFGILAVVFVLAFITARQSRRKCIFAFGQGVADARKLSWTDIRSRFDSYLKPMRAADAAAYRRGLEYSLSIAAEPDLESMKKCFLDAYASGTITGEGADLKKLGAEAASRNFRLRIPLELEAEILNNPETPPLRARVRKVNEENSTNQPTDITI